MNRGFRSALVETSKGGRSRGGATLTATGRMVLFSKDTDRRSPAAAPSRAPVYSSRRLRRGMRIGNGRAVRRTALEPRSAAHAPDQETVPVSRRIVVAAAQLGPIARDEPREHVVARLVALLRESSARGAG